MHENIACWDKKCKKNLRVSHVTTLSIYDDIVQNRCILPLLMILTKLLIKSIMWPFINDGLKLLLLSNIILDMLGPFYHPKHSNTSLDLVVTITQEAWAIFRQIFGMSHGFNGL